MVESRKFLYGKLYDELKENILNGTLERGERLSAEAVFQEKYSVSSITVKKALNMLVQEGLVHRIPGRGSFVAQEMPETPESGLAMQNRCLSGRRSDLIGVLLEHVATPFGLDMLYEMDRIALQRGLRLCIRFSYADRKREADEIRFLLSMGVAGLIIMPSHGPHYSTEILRLVVDGFPVILVDKCLEGVPVIAVRTDNEHATATLVDHLISRGRRRIALVTADKVGTSSLLERQKGFYDAMAHHGLSAAEECAPLPYPVLINDDHAIWQEVFHAYFLRMRGQLDGVVCAEYGLVQEVLEGMEACGIRVPEDVALCCIDEDYEAARGPFCTHMRQDEKQIAKRAVALMADWIAGNPPVFMDHKIPAVFHQGAST